jgi:hypothetical protein
MNTKKKNLFISKPILFIGLGILIIGFIYDIIFINIPPQDAPDYLIKERNELYKKLSIIYNTAYIALAISLIKGAVEFVIKKRAITQKCYVKQLRKG